MLPKRQNRCGYPHEGVLNDVSLPNTATPAGEPGGVDGRTPDVDAVANLYDQQNTTLRVETESYWLLALPGPRAEHSRSASTQIVHD